MTATSIRNLTFLDGLNENQREAVTAPASGRLQIIAGPGTGKTKVLTSRVAYLLLVEKIRPEHIIVTTFTKKAANELVDRLGSLLKSHTEIKVSNLLVGTFHSLCYRIIKKFGSKIGVSGYTVADERDKDHLLRELLEKDLSGEAIGYIKDAPREEILFLASNKKNDKYYGIDINKLKRQISKLKSQGISPESYTNVKGCNKCLQLLYSAYQSKLAEEKKLDFDDCLLTCYNLVTKFPVLHFVKHVLVDEFQDTNDIQLRLMYQFATGNITDPKFQHNVTIVGDPDQSIYAFRDAQAKNFGLMLDHYKRLDLACGVIALNQNYRSTNDILQVSEKLMRQQQDRQVKDLVSQFKDSVKPVYKCLLSAKQEAKWIAYQIEFLLKLPHSMIKPNDIAILFRAAFQTRAVEAELVKRKVPYFMIRGKAFWERKEVVSIIDYLRVCGDENDRISIFRTLNFPKRGLGDKTLQSIDDIVMSGKRSGFTAYQTLKALSMDKLSSLKLPHRARNSVAKYVQMIDEARKILNKMEPSCTDRERTAFAIELFELVYQESGLKVEFSSDEEKALNIEEVKNQFVSFEPQDETFIGNTDDSQASDDRNFIVQFVESVGLYATDDKDDENSNKPKVSLSTIHGSKGLEWPVVFVPGLSEGLLPAGFAMYGSDSKDAVDEERRCFYVACTRAKVLLYISAYKESASSSSSWRQQIDSESRFVTKLNDLKAFDTVQTALKTPKGFQKLCSMLGITYDSSIDGELEQLFQSYAKNWDIYSNDDTFEATISPEDAMSVGFAKASGLSQDLNLKKRKLDYEAEPFIRQQPKPQSQRQVGDLRNDSYLGEDPVVFLSSTKINKAPNTGVNKAPSTAVNKAFNAKSNKAPPYVPQRRSKSTALGVKR
ncbi:srs2 [Candida theae]|uniref:DNA 3'-5' helicase n=1 Tax=Candida theae TaxID=1198502 RepID=A0AAD5B9Y0_9ASCO|nr:srs2 [Candida theae]KAI5948691.1 srs2 [Candida theae]